MTEDVPATLYANLSPDAAGPAPVAPAVRSKSGPIERRQRLSRSIVWDLMRKFYTRQGIDSWGKRQIPYQITSNPHIATAYARVVAGFVRDCQAGGGGPVDIVELGAGHGRFSFLFLKKLLAAHRRSALAHVPLRYVMTDLAEKNVEHWRAHPMLRPFVDEGTLDFARYEVGHDREIRLVCSGDVISPDRPRDNLAVFANYLFDSVPMDVFHVAAGQLQEVLVTLTWQGAPADLDEPSSLARTAVTFEQGPARDDYYEDPSWNEILAGYRARLSDCSFHFPTTALTCLRDLRRLSRRSFLLISADKGYTDEESLIRGAGQPNMTPHAPGCFSMMVNYHAIEQHFLQQGGMALHPAQEPTSLNVSAFVVGDGAAPFTETRQAYAESIETQGPDDVFTIGSVLEAQLPSMSLAELLTYLRVVGYDSRAFLRSVPFLDAHAAEASDAERRALWRAVQRVWEEHYPVDDEVDLAFQIGVLLYTMAYYPEAIAFSVRSVERHGPSPGSLHNMGLCYWHLRRLTAASECFDQALELDPDYEPARAMRLRVGAAMKEDGPSPR